MESGGVPLLDVGKHRGFEVTPDANDVRFSSTSIGSIAAGRRKEKDGNRDDKEKEGRGEGHLEEVKGVLGIKLRRESGYRIYLYIGRDKRAAIKKAGRR